MELLSLGLNVLFGGGFITSLISSRNQRKKLSAEARGQELDNVQEAIAIWRNMASELRKELEASRQSYEAMSKQVETLKRAVSRLTTVNNKMVKLLDKITPDNLESMVSEIKKLHNEN